MGPTQRGLLHRSTGPLPRGGQRPRIVALGGGTGLPVLLRGLRRAYFGSEPPDGRPADRDLITAIVTVADDGGSSGRLRRTYQILPPGDIRNCLLALSDADSTLSAMFSFRFGGESEVAGHSLGNLILAALSQLEGDFCSAIECGALILGARGRVLPSTTEPITLSAEFADGSRMEGESQIPTARRPIRRLALEPQVAYAVPDAIRAIEASDMVVIAPGSLYTSLIPVLLVKDIAEAMARRRVPVMLVMNLMTEPGETDGYTAADHVIAIRRHAPALPIHDILLHTRPLPEELARDYAMHGSVPVPLDIDLLPAMGYRTIERDLLGTGPKIRHDSDKLARAIIQRAREVSR